MTRRELEMDLQDLFEGCLVGEAFENLQRKLREDPEARNTYREYALLHHSLKFRGKGVDLLRVVPMDRIVARRNKRSLRIAGFSAAAVLAISAIVMALMLAHTPPPTLTFEVSPGTELMISHRITDENPPQGQILEPGSRLLIEHGSVELEFASGVRSVIRGPANLTLRREDLLEIQKGTGWFHVPKKAVGFQVITPDFVLTDLGTAFGIISKPNFLDEVHVFEGEVELLNRHGLKQKQILKAKNARAAGPAGRWDDIPVRTDPFFTKLPATEQATIALNDSATFTSSPENELIRTATFRFTTDKELAGFDGSKSDKLVVTLSHENGTIRNVTYGGVNMVPAVEALSAGGQKTAIYYLDFPPAPGDLVAVMSGSCNGIGGSILALSNTAPGEPSAIGSAKAKSASLTTRVGNCFLVASHANNDNERNARADAQSPLVPLFAGPTGSSAGGSGFLHIGKPTTLSVKFSGQNVNPSTVVAAFAPIP